MCRRVGVVCRPDIDAACAGLVDVAGGVVAAAIVVRALQVVVAEYDRQPSLFCFVVIILTDTMGRAMAMLRLPQQHNFSCRRSPTLLPSCNLSLHHLKYFMKD